MFRVQCLPGGLFIEFIRRDQPQKVYNVKVCTQCGECALVCPAECIKQDDRGVYYVVQEDCIMCEACVPVCPEGVMFMDANLVPNTAWECDLCGDCVEVCGTSALWIAEKELA
jgi:ferredoxin